MAVLAYDDVWLREPRLMVPRLGPIGPVRLNDRHPVSNKLSALHVLGNNGLWYRNLVANSSQTMTASVDAVVSARRYGISVSNAVSKISGSISNPFGSSAVFGTNSGSAFIVADWASHTDRSYGIYFVASSTFIFMILNGYVNAGGSLVIQSGTFGALTGTLTGGSENFASALNGTNRVFGLSRDSGTLYAVLDGVMSTGRAESTNMTNAFSELSFGGASGANRGMPGGAYMIGFTKINSPLTPGEWKLVGEDPFGLVIPA